MFFVFFEIAQNECHKGENYIRLLLTFSNPRRSSRSLWGGMLDMSRKRSNGPEVFQSQFKSIY